MSVDHLSNEWSILQRQSSQFEVCSLIIKLVSVVIVSLGLLNGVLNGYFIVISCVLWLQDAIWKTFQSRLEARLLTLEECLAANQGEALEVTAYQLNKQFLINRPKGLNIVLEYLGQAGRPTVAFPYIALLVTIFYYLFFG